MDFQELLPTIAKLVNLLLFASLMYYFLRRPIKEAFRARQESIRNELLRAEEERDAAVAKLEEVEGRLARLDAEVEAIRANAQREAADERARVERATEEEMRKIREQARREIESAAKTARAELRAFTAEQSVKLAEELIRRDIRPEDDAHLVREYVEELGGIGR
ncbi:MAG: F-type H+-transporting ATPase subunit b [Acidobacteriota bacterium]|jgi:ATP synthase F0 subunit b|nr:F-type H+-transporting ATPase subunit b [Acidobacteriota bacterium]